MRLLSVRLIVSLFVGITAISLLFSYYSVRAGEIQRRNELERRAEVLGESLSTNVEHAIPKGSSSSHSLQKLVERFGHRENLTGIAVYDLAGNRLAVTPDLANLLNDRPPVVAKAIVDNLTDSEYTHVGNASLYIRVLPLHDETHVIGALAVVYDSGFIAAQTRKAWRETFLRVLLQMLLIVGLTLLIVRWSLSGPIARAALWLRTLRTQRGHGRRPAPELDLFQPLARELKTIAESLDHARSAAEREARLRQAGESIWTPERLEVYVHSKLGNSPLFVVSNREPYLHVRHGKNIEVEIPASGLVTALEPILRACNGTWIAHGSADADREMVDAKDRLRVPPDDPHYTLRRVWLSSEEE